MLPIKKIVCPTDFSEPSKAGLEAAIELAGKYNARIHLVYVLFGSVAERVVRLASCPVLTVRQPGA